MSFTSPWLLWALFTASIPIIIHLVNRWRHRSVRWAAMEFLLRAARETRGTKKLLHYLILALRVLAVAALVTAFARPLLGSFFGWGSSGLNEVLLVLDRSASMDARPDKTNSLRDTIPPLVKSTFDQLANCRLSLLDSTTETITQIPAPEALADLTVSKVTDGGADIPSLLQKAIPYLEESASGKTEIWIASDMQSSSWRPNSPVWSSVRQRLAALPIPPSVRIMALRDRPETNRSIRITQAQINNGRLVLDMEILRQGFDPNQPEEVPVNISVNNSVASSTLQLAGATTTIRKEIPLPQDKESGFGYVSLPHDDFSRDDISFFTFAPKPLANILINGPSGEAGKILSLMAAPPGLPGRKAAMPNTVHSGQFNLSSQALVIWHGPAPRADMEEKLKTFIEEGGLVLFLPDDTADGTRRQFLGVSWGAMETAPADEYFRVESWDRQRGFLRDGTDQTPIPANRLRAIRRKPLAGKYRVLASWDDGTCALGQVRAGAGSALFLTTLPKYSWSNLADGHLLLPLLQRMADRGAERFSSAISLRVNDHALPQSATDVPMRMDDAQGSRPPGSPVDTAGVYRLGAQTYAVNRPWSEDNPDQLTDEKIHILLPDAAISAMQGGVENPSLVQEAWKLFLLIALGCLLLEALLCLPKRMAKRPTPANRL